MNGDTCLLVTVLYNGTLLQCALRVADGALDQDALEYPMEPESREKIHALLPLHVRSCGPIVQVDSIFDIAV